MKYLQTFYYCFVPSNCIINSSARNHMEILKNFRVGMMFHRQVPQKRRCIHVTWHCFMEGTLSTPFLVTMSSSCKILDLTMSELIMQVICMWNGWLYKQTRYIQIRCYDREQTHPQMFICIIVWYIYYNFTIIITLYFSPSTVNLTVN